MPKLTYHCPICQKQLVLSKEIKLGSTKLNEYKCGHIFSKDMLSIDKSTLDFTSVDGSGKKARAYQETGVLFILESGFNSIIGDQMRLGKTPQALLALKQSYKERTPALILARSANLWQWIREYKVWCDTLPNGIFPILGTSAWIPPGFSAYIISMDTFSCQSKCQCGHRYHETDCKGNGKKCACKTYRSTGESMVDKLKKIPFKLIIADEAHSFKNTTSNRSQALVEFVNFLNTSESNLTLTFNCSRCNIEWQEQGKVTYDKRIGHKIIHKDSYCVKCQQYCYIQQQSKEATTIDKACGLILLTGTAIKNRAEEYFVPLNLVNPEKFSSLEGFRRKWLEQNSKGQWNRVKSHLLDSFKQEIAPYVLRREKEDVYTDLPPLNRIFTIVEPDKDMYSRMYNSMVDKLETKLADKVNPSYWDFAEDLMELRRICGLMKLSWVADYLEASLLDSDNQRYAVGIHHKSVRDLLYFKMGSDENCLKLSGEDSSWSKDHIMRNFENSKQRILIINMLAGGIGMDFHYCNNVLVLERQWSSADEEQFEYRFYNPDMSIKTASTNIEYIIAKGTIDEWWFDMVEVKRKIFGETIGTHFNIQQDSVSFKELLDRTIGSRI